MKNNVWSKLAITTLVVGFLMHRTVLGQAGNHHLPPMAVSDASAHSPSSVEVASLDPHRPDPAVLGTFAWVSLDRITANAQVLTGQIPYQGAVIQSRHIYHPDHALAKQYLEAQLAATGLEVTEERFDCGGNTPCANLVVELEGDTSPETIWVVGAHYDSTNGGDWHLPAPGAVDNASGVVVVLEVLEGLRRYHVSDTVRFILFDGEEEGLLGSAYHARMADARHDQIALFFDLDVPGWRDPDHNAAFSSSDFPSWPDLQVLNHIAILYPTGTWHVGVPWPGNDSADVASFWDYGYHAFLTGSLYAVTGLMNTADDTYDHLDLDQCANVARLVLAYIGERAGVH